MWGYLVLDRWLEMKENEVAKRILDVAFDIHRRLGPGLLETVYEVVLAQKLREVGLHVERQVKVAIEFDGVRFDEGFRADLVVENSVVVELKSVKSLEPVHPKQLRTYLRLLDLKLGLLINFNEELLKSGIKRVVNGLED